MAQSNEKTHEETKLFKWEIINQTYPSLHYNNNLLKVSKKTTEKKVSSHQLFDINFNPQAFIVAEHIKYEFFGTTYLNCTLYEYKEEKEINSMIKEVYHELGIIKDGKVIVKYQTKDLYSGGVYYREIAEIKEVEIDLSNQLTVYPNPFETYFSLTSNLSITEQNIKVLNIEGKDVSNQFQFLSTSKNQFKISLNKSLKKGIYIILITTEDYIVSKKMIKQ